MLWDSHPERPCEALWPAVLIFKSLPGQAPDM